MRVKRAIACAILTACASQGDDGPGPDTTEELFEYEPGLFVALSAESKADLPNSQFSPRGLDTSGNRAIADKFIAAMYNVQRTNAVVALDWPLTSSRAVLNRSGTPIRLTSSVYEHTGFDIIRLSDTEDPTVHAPVAGKATITDWSGGASSPTYDYSTVISIWDPQTHLIVQLMHVKPDPMLPRTGFFDVTRGQPIGELAEVPSVPQGRHTHLSVVDAEHYELLDPVTVLPAYPDTKKPTASELYLLDETAKRYDTLKTGPLDIIVTAHDRDDMSPRNLEVTSLAFVAKDQTGNVIAQLDRCHLRDAFEKLVTDWNTSSTTIRLIDFGNASGQFSGFWPGSDLGNPDRLFRYALTNLKLVNGSCTLVANDRDGQIMVPDTMTRLLVTVELWDARDNREMKQYTLERMSPP